MGDGGAAPLAASGHAGAADGVAADGCIDGARVLSRATLDQREIALAHLAAGEHRGEPGMGRIVLGDEDEAAGLLVQAMHDSRDGADRRRGKLAHVVEQGVDQRAAIARVFGGARAGVDHHAGRLVDHREVVVFIDDSRGMASGMARSGGGSGSARIEIFSPPRSLRDGLPGLPSTRTPPCASSSCTRARLMGKLVGQEEVETLAAWPLRAALPGCAQPRLSSAGMGRLQSLSGRRSQSHPPKTPSPRQPTGRR